MEEMRAEAFGDNSKLAEAVSKGFKPSRTLVVALTVLLGLHLFADAISVVTSGLVLSYYPDLEASMNTGEEGALIIGGLDGLAALGLFVVTVTSAILFCVWIYRANVNARALGNWLEFTPGWAVGWWFIPIAFLYKPYQVVKELYMLAVDPTGETPGAPHGTAILAPWWALWLLSTVISNISLRLTLQGLEEAAIAAGLIASLFSVLAAPLVITIVLRIHRWQLQQVGLS